MGLCPCVSASLLPLLSKMDFKLQDCIPKTMMLKPTSIQIKGIFSGRAVANVSNSPETESSRDRTHDKGKPQNLMDVKVLRQGVHIAIKCQHSLLPVCPVSTKHGGVHRVADVTVFKVMECRNACILNGEEVPLGVNMRITNKQLVGGCSWIHCDDVIALVVKTGMQHSMMLIHIIQVERI